MLVSAVDSWRGSGGSGGSRDGLSGLEWVGRLSEAEEVSLAVAVDVDEPTQLVQPKLRTSDFYGPIAPC